MPKYIVKERYVEQVQGVRTYEVEADDIQAAHDTIPDKVLTDQIETRDVVSTSTFAIQLAQ